MEQPKPFTPWDFLQLVKDLNEHEAELKERYAAPDRQEAATGAEAEDRE